MENRVRDLEHIQEKENDDRSRRFGIVILAVFSIVGLTFAMGVVVGRAAKPTHEELTDPHIKLDHVANMALSNSKETSKIPQIKAENLTCPIPLAEQNELKDDDRPEITDALEAAAAEEAELSGQTHTEQIPKDMTTNEGGIAERDIFPAAESARSSREHLKRTAEYDPLVTAAIKKSHFEKQAQKGKDGEYTIQVISYESPEPANAFADGLRARGHKAFVIKADVPERGRFYRVRIGPFESKWRAHLYQQKFEEEERMSTFVVRRKEEPSPN